MTPRSLRAVARDALVHAGAIPLAPLWLIANLARQLGGGDHFFAGCSELLSLIPSTLGVFLRRSFYRMTLDECATDVHLGFGTTLPHPQVRIGRGVYVGNRCTLGMCHLDDHAMLGSNVDLLSGRRQHRFDAADVPIHQQGGSFSAVHIGRNAWIGNSTVIMADVGAGAVIGAGTVVVRPIPDGAVAVGNPAQIKRLREVA